MKWNYGKTGEGYGYDNLPPIGEEVLAVFEGMAGFQRPDSHCEVWADHDTGQNGNAQ